MNRGFEERSACVYELTKKYPEHTYEELLEIAQTVLDLQSDRIKLDAQIIAEED